MTGNDAPQSSQMRLGRSAARAGAGVARLAATANREPSAVAQRRLTVAAGVAAVLTVVLFAALITMQRSDSGTWPSNLTTQLRAADFKNPLARVLGPGSWQHGWPVTTAADTLWSVWPAVWPALRPSVWRAGVHDLAAGR
ncbi:hypothetical protein GCM10010532_098290 [Dactylosporangium siamense]|uniref:Uncharacterized protein n=1 Tax=Dactylosporangium siamense TaxID=685454 RepID=A0A919Q1W9_9ACTN|nr:hypothetical protein Dsi01nite_109240 [Dactylosporangium siamense]